MSNLDPNLEAVLLALVRGLKDLQVPFVVLGALVPELLLDERPAQATLDADVVVFVADLDAFERVKNQLRGFVPDAKKLFRLHYERGGRADILPYSKQLAPNGVLDIQPDHHFNLAGYDKIAGANELVKLDTGDEFAVVSIPMYVLLKLVAYTDRHEQKDIRGVDHCLNHYAHDGDRRYGLKHGDARVPFEYGFAYLLGQDARLLLDDRMRATIRPLLDDIAPVDFEEDEKAPYLGRQKQARRLWFRTGLDV